MYKPYNDYDSHHDDDDDDNNVADNEQNKIYLDIYSK